MFSRLRRVWGRTGERRVPAEPVLVRGDGSGRRALLAYLASAFDTDPTDPVFRSHTNRWRCVTIADLLEKSGYSVFSVDWTATKFKANGFNLVVGLGPAFDKAVKASSDAKRIYLGTGAHWAQNNRAVVERQREVARSRGAMIGVQTLSPESGAEAADVIAVVGNAWVADTYRGRSNALIVHTPNSVTDGVVPTLLAKHYRAARKSFLWMAAYGALRRRLDVVLDVFSRNQDLSLVVCGGVEKEKGFVDCFRSQLFDTSNIEFVGWVDVAGDTYRDVTARCGYMIYPSVSDGMPGSVVNAMASGVVPIVTREAGIDVSPYGVVLDDGSAESIERAVRECSERHPDSVRDAAEKSSKVAFSMYARCQFEEAFLGVLDKVS